MSVSDNQYLAHFGIFGMKWGVRRYQNEDGSLTEEGKIRYQKRLNDVEYAKDYSRKKIAEDEKSRDFWKKSEEKTRSTPATKDGIKKLINISDEDYELYLDEFKTPEKIIDYLAKNDAREVRIFTDRIKNWNRSLKKLNKLEVNAIASDSEHMKQIDNIFTSSENWLYRSIDTSPLHWYIDQKRKEKSK